MEIEMGKSDGEEEDIDVLFPRNKEGIEDAIKMLQQQYSKDKHQGYMVNHCFRCHDPELATTYNQFRKSQLSGLREPPMSKFYKNEAFISPLQLIPFFKGQTQHYSQHVIPPIPKNLREILDRLFELYGFIPHLERFLLFYPNLLEKLFDLNQTLFKGQKMQSKNEYFLAFIGSAQLGSTSMMARYYWLFKRSGGEDSWINEGAFPKKYKDILNINHLMARAVWQIDQNTIANILEESGSFWNPSELAHCFEILAFAHHCSTIALALGLNIEWPLGQLSLNNFDKIVETFKIFKNKNTSNLINSEKLSTILPLIEQCEHQPPTKPQTSSKFVKNSNTEDEVQPFMKQIGEQLQKQQLYRQLHNYFPFILTPFRVIKKRKENIYPLVDYSDYNFLFSAYPLLNSLTQEAADKLKSFIEYSGSMARNKYLPFRHRFGSEKAISTKQFRKAMVYYSQNLCGYRHIEYDYKKNHSLLTIAMKFYIRLLTLSPIHMTSQVIRGINHESGMTECFDLGHTAVLVAGAKMSLELTLVMRVFEFD